MANRERMTGPETMPAALTFDAGLRFLERNGRSEGWFLQIETFDPHEPFFAPDEDIAAVAGEMPGPIFDWPPYAKVTETDAEVAQLRARYRALVRFCDRQLGRLLDAFDKNDLWDDTALLATTDHGFLLGEHDWWAKNRMHWNKALFEARGLDTEAPNNWHATPGSWDTLVEYAKEINDPDNNIYGITDNWGGVGSMMGEITEISEQLELMPGVTAIPTPGHTAGHISLLVETADERVLIAGDTAMIRSEYTDRSFSQWYGPEQLTQLHASLDRVQALEPTLVICGHGG